MSQESKNLISLHFEEIALEQEEIALEQDELFQEFCSDAEYGDFDDFDDFDGGDRQNDEEFSCYDDYGYGYYGHYSQVDDEILCSDPEVRFHPLYGIMVNPIDGDFDHEDRYQL